MNKNIGKAEITDHHRRVLQNASGSIRMNLNLYPSRITEIAAIDPFVRELPSVQITIKPYPDAAEKMHFEDNTFDIVFITFSFCSVSILYKTLKEIARVLKLNVKLLFIVWEGSYVICTVNAEYIKSIF